MTTKAASNITDNIALITENRNALDVEYHTKNISLLVFDLIIFVIITYLSHSSYKKFSNAKPEITDESIEDKEENKHKLSDHENRVNFIKGLMIANGSNN